MGYFGWVSFGHNADRSNPDGMQHIPTEGVDVGFELYGYLIIILLRLVRDYRRAKSLATHAHRQAPLTDPEVVYQIAASAVEDIRRLKASLGTGSGSGRLLVVAEPHPRFPLKKPEDDARAKEADAHITDNEYRQALAVTDCIVRLIKAELDGEDGITFIVPPAEAEATLMRLLNEGQIGLVLMCSNDSDSAAYAGTKGLIVLCPEIRGDTDGIGRGPIPKGVSLWGKPVSAANIWKRTGTDHDVDRSHFTLLQRAAMFAMKGHDFDTVRSGKAPKPVGIPNVGPARAAIAVDGTDISTYVGNSVGALSAGWCKRERLVSIDHRRTWVPSPPSSDFT